MTVSIYNLFRLAIRAGHLLLLYFLYIYDTVSFIIYFELQLFKFVYYTATYLPETVLPFFIIFVYTPTNTNTHNYTTRTT